MSKRLYVGNLPFSTTNEELNKMFSHYGTVTEAQVVVNKFSGRSKGFGFVTLQDDAHASKAIAEMNGKEVNGRKIVVNEAKPFDPNAPRPERRSFGGRGRFGGNRGGFGRSGGFGENRRFNKKEESNEDDFQDEEQ